MDGTIETLGKRYHSPTITIEPFRELFKDEVRAVTSTDGMTADWYPMPYEVLGKMSSRIINEVRGINRVVYDITSKPPGMAEWE